MGLFSFVKSIGEKLGGGEKIQKENLSAHIKSLGLPVERFLASFNEDGESVDIFGYVPDLATKEKLILAVGNLQGISKVNEHLRIGAPPPPPAATTAAPTPAEEKPAALAPEEDVKPTSVFYTVKSGDTLSKIAKETLGTANRYPEIFEANKPMLKHPDKIFPGQVLRIPG
ncbi:LysM domain-containing protein [Panacagrimonas perspica]|uniref:Potassium binding protein Kbp n=1 Tax=Panacagrimonas perspica TaxID=381431 RepID=A0A4R7PA46_9GAMM|nr:peptidoglycan-binding protein LysM [Panacagrimonas perspica]TDU30893.1 LysM domain-containing protein [Panacagrimonas perspica]THD02000.1 peptidoglycan-binding protein LysM [Panacagrimonas perspica]